MSSQPSPSERFKQNTIILFDIIIEMFEEGSENNVIDNDIRIISVLKIFLESCSGERMINNFIKKTNKHWEKIKDRDIEYFKNHGLSLFTSIKEDGLDTAVDQKLKKENTFFKNLKFADIDCFKKLLESTYSKNGKEFEILSQERKDDIWKILSSFVKISVVHIHQERNYVNGEYSQEYYPEISIKDNVKKWGIRSIKF